MHKNITEIIQSIATHTTHSNNHTYKSLVQSLATTLRNNLVGIEELPNDYADINNRVYFSTPATDNDLTFEDYDQKATLLCIWVSFNGIITCPISVTFGKNKDNNTYELTLKTPRLYETDTQTTSVVLFKVLDDSEVQLESVDLFAKIQHLANTAVQKLDDKKRGRNL